VYDHPFHFLEISLSYSHSQTKTSSPKRDRSSSPMDMETSSGEEEDGQITKHEEEDEKDRKLFGKSNPDDEPIMLPDLEKCRLSRDSIAKYCMRPWFGEYVKGMLCSAAMSCLFFLKRRFFQVHGCVFS